MGRPEEGFAGPPGARLTDSKALFDKLMYVVFAPKGEGGGVDVEATAVKDERPGRQRAGAGAWRRPVGQLTDGGARARAASASA